MLRAYKASALEALDLHSTNALSAKFATRDYVDVYENLSHLTPLDRARFVLYGIGPRIPQHTSLSIHSIFSARAGALGEAVAATHFVKKISYRQLDNLSGILAAELRLQGVTRGDRVCLLVQRSLLMLVGILAVLKAGASYIPLDGGVVTDNILSFVLADSRAKMLLYNKSCRKRLPSSVPSLCLDTFEISAAWTPSNTVYEPSQASDEAYVIYTSGTTGTPKGVSVSHENVINLLCSSPGNLGIRPGVKVAQLLNVAFDMCVWEIFSTLLNGGTLVIRGSSKQDWEETMKAVDVVISTPTILRGYDPVLCPKVKVVATAGEPCPQSLADRWSQSKTFYNSCGPTETTIVNTMRLHKHESRISIGSPTPNNCVYILDEDMRPVPIGVVGVMWAGGKGVSRGYVNREDLTRQRYLPDPFCKNGIMFNTGDLGRWNDRGELEHLGRLDDQVKIKGFRVELDGVAAVMESHPGVTKAVCLLMNGELWGFTASYVDPDALHHFISQRVPFYAVPCRLLALRWVPMTRNGKVDKRVLQQLVASHESTIFDHHQIKGALATM